MLTVSLRIGRPAMCAIPLGKDSEAKRGTIHLQGEQPPLAVLLVPSGIKQPVLAVSLRTGRPARGAISLGKNNQR